LLLVVLFFCKLR